MLQTGIIRCIFIFLFYFEKELAMINYYEKLFTEIDSYSKITFNGQTWMNGIWIL